MLDTEFDFEDVSSHNNHSDFQRIITTLMVWVHSHILNFIKCIQSKQEWFKVSNSRRQIKRSIRISIILMACLLVFYPLKYLVNIDIAKETTTINVQNENSLEDKADLRKADISSFIKQVDFSRTPITSSMLMQNYEKVFLTGFVSNINVEQTDSDKLKNLETSHMYDVNFPDSGKKVPDIKQIEKDGRKSYDSITTCEDLSYNNSIYYSSTMNILGDDLVSLRRTLLKADNWLVKEVQDKDDKLKDETEIVETQWFRFGGSSIWLEQEQCYLVFSRIVYSRIKQKNHPHVSLIRGQAFDKNWKEIQGKKIPYIDVQLPNDIDTEFGKLEEELGVSDCKEFINDQINYDFCKVQQAKSHLQNLKRKDTVSSKYFVTYPVVFDIPFDANGDWKGPEDPHVILRDMNNTQESVVLFNMDDHVGGGRRMFSYMPHRKLDNIQRLDVPGRQLRISEKNWTPFFHPSDNPRSLLSRGFIHFIYSFSPLEIFRCSLNDGICEVVFDADTLELSTLNSFGGMRGGTQFVPLPKSLPRLQNKNIWVGFPKLHISNCGCGDIFYRPMLSLLIESKGVYHQELVVPAIDFNIDVLSWDLLSDQCKETNILSPNSIVHWDVFDQNSKTKEFQDYLTLTVSESDALTKVVTLKGVLNYILGIYKDKDIRKEFVPNREADVIISKTLGCLIDEAKQNCRKYGDKHRLL
ncbi:hypothetical protein C6P45_000924 [Maudiozyma exigua]|uniref:Uncharacterized protein n=1 Tax=Maudiozyma exigua TaxID=34358 RepID=A0A9P6W2Q2_MAUEX|nr:hypothetical protein C6P45_000924 [Kazachstania exigua]